MRLSRFAILGALVVGVIGCRDDSNDPVSSVIPTLAFVRYINAVPDTLNTTMRFIDQVQFVPLTFVNVPYRGLAQGNYQGVRLDAHHIRVFTADVSDYNAAGNTAILVDTSFTFQAGKYYTLLHTGYARAGSTPRQQLQLIEDVFPTPGTSVAVRFINSSLNLGAMDFYLLPSVTSTIGGTPTQSALALAAVSSYSTMAAGTLAARTTAAGTVNPLAAGAPTAGATGNPFAPASNGVPAVPAVDPTAGLNVPGSVLTGIAFPASVTGSRAAAAAAPSVVFFPDKQPPRYTTP